MADHDEREGSADDAADPAPTGGGGDASGRPMTRESFAQAVIARVRQRFPLVRIGRARQPFSVRVNGHVAELENLYRISQLNPGAMQHQVERWMVELLRAGEGRPDQQAGLDEVRGRIMPMLLVGNPEDYALSPTPRTGGAVRPKAAVDLPGKPAPSAADVPASTPLTLGGRGLGLAVRPLVPGLSVGYVIDGDQTVAYIPSATLERWYLDIEELDVLAVENLVKRSQALNAAASQDAKGRVNLVLFQMLDGFDASRLLLPNLHDRLREHVGSPFLAAVPNRDILVCVRDDGETIESLRRQIRHDHQTRPHSITERLLLVTADGIAAND